MSIMSQATHNDNVDGVHMHLENKKESRVFFWFIWVMYALVYMTKSCYSAAMAAIVSEGVLTKSQTGFITAAFYVIYGPLQILGGIVADKYNPERMIKLSLVGGALANLVIFINQNYYVMLAAWCFNAVAQFALWPSVFKILTSQLVRSDRSMMTSYISLSATVGLFLSYLAASFVSKWQYNFAISSGILFVLAVLMHIIYNKIEPDMKPDKEVKREEKTKHEIPTAKLFLISGFFAMLIPVISRVMVDNYAKTLSPTMIMESYSNVSPMLANRLGLIVIVSGLVGIAVAKVLYPRFVKNELALHVGALVLCIPFSLILRRVGTASIALVIVSLCMISVLFNVMRLLTFNYNMRFVKFGRNGTAAGISNFGESMGIMIQSYGFTLVAEKLGWVAVADTSTIFIIVSIAFNVLAMLMWRRFIKKVD